METNTIVSNIGVLDIFFISVFLVSNIVLGLISRRKCWDNKEYKDAKSALKLAAMTYVLAALASLTELLRLISIVNSRKED